MLRKLEIMRLQNKSYALEVKIDNALAQGNYSRADKLQREFDRVNDRLDDLIAKEFKS